MWFGCLIKTVNILTAFRVTKKCELHSYNVLVYEASDKENR